MGDVIAAFILTLFAFIRVFAFLSPFLFLVRTLGPPVAPLIAISALHLLVEDAISTRDELFSSLLEGCAIVLVEHGCGSLLFVLI